MFQSLTIFVFSCALCLAGQVDSSLESATKAMDAGLWEVAVIKLTEALDSPELGPERKVELAILLAENLVRDNKPEAALEILAQSLLEHHPDRAFWSGQALAGLGRFAEAVATLLPVAEDPRHELHAEAAFTASSLQLSLSQPEAALKTLQSAARSADKDTASQAKLRQIEILLDLGRFEEARELFPETSSPGDPLATLLEAHLLLGENRPAEAELLFSDLLANPEGQTLLRHHHAAIGKADALAAQGKTEAATESLLTFIQSHQDSPLLDPIFRRIIAWLPEKPISADHPTLLRLREWSPATPPPSIGPVALDSASAVAAWPTSSAPPPDLALFSLYARALALRSVPTVLAKSEAKLLLQRIRLFAPQHFLTARSVLTYARWLLDEYRSEEAFALLDNVLRSAKSPLIQGEAAFLNARIAFDHGDSSLAAALFDQAAGQLADHNAETALLNAAIVRLVADPEAPAVIAHDDPATAARLNADLALERALATIDPAKAKSALDAFLSAHPKHPRAIEARIAISEAALNTSPPDLSLARAQLDTLASSSPPVPADQTARVDLARLRLEDLSNSPEKAIELAQLLIETHPDSPQAAEAAVIQGRNYFQAGNYNQARIVLEKAAASVPGTQLSQAALLLAARAAALGATAQSREQALAIYDQAMAVDGPLQSLALLEKARLTIDLNRLPQAIAILREAYGKFSPDDPARLPTGLLLAEAIYGQGDANPASLNEALEIHNQLLALTETQPSLYFRLQYLRGLILEKLPDPENPQRTRLGDALAAYYSVLERPVDPPPAEWEFFERSGFRALSLLENAERWRAAIAIAEKIASFRGPRSEEASTRARQLRLKHMIWDE